ncbi:MAG: T9SS type A sorting domain-containing protein [Fluviicola sp.]|nr:T9SS type A sorting domain-containing protein [Fluviicola sp.]
MYLKQSILLLLLSVSIAGISFHGNSQLLHINCSPAPQLDGIATADEWSLATEGQISLGNQITTIACMHDSTHLYFLFRDHLESSIRFPEIMIDVNNSKESVWQADDWWFHVSATDCDNQGSSDDYTNCQTVQPDWIGVNNMLQGAPYTDTVEIAIPFSKIGYTFGSGDSIGIAFDITNTMNAWHMYPETADRTDPFTWATAVISCSGLGVAETETDLFHVYPNPTDGNVTVSMRSNVQPTFIELVQTDGMVVWKADYQVCGESFKLPSDLAKGNYLMVVHHTNGTERQLIQIQ